MVKEFRWYNFYIIDLIKVIFLSLHVIKLYNYSTDRHLKIIYIVCRVENLCILEIQEVLGIQKITLGTRNIVE